MNKFVLIACLILSSVTSLVSAQQSITGNVKDQHGNALAGAFIQVAGKNTYSDKQGNFTLPQIKQGDSIIVSFTGLVTYRTVIIQLNTPLSITLQDDNRQLEEVLVSTGYQRLPKERATGSFVQVDQELLNRAVSANVLDRLKDIVPGLVFNRGPLSGNAETQISIRGQSTISAAVDPLIVLNNFPFEGNINDINPNDVESITVLKDAAAASIWGAKAANGVIVITTKAGLYTQKPVLSFNSNITASEKPDLFAEPRISVSDYIDNEIRLFGTGYYRNSELSVNKVPLSPVVELLIAKRDNQVSETDFNNTLRQYKSSDLRQDAAKYLYRSALSRQLAGSVQGGSSAQRYFISGGFDDALANATGNESQRITINASHTLSFLKERLEFNTQLGYTNSHQQFNSPGSISTLRMSATSLLYPYVKLADEQGNPLTVTKDYRKAFTDNPGAGLLNWTYSPLQELELADNENRTSSYQLNTALQYKVIKGLTAQALYQYGESRLSGRNLQKQESYFTRDLINQLSTINPDGNVIRPIPLGAIADYSNARRQSSFLRTQLNYQANFSELHQVNAIAGWEIKQADAFSNAYRLYGYDPEHAVSKIVDYVGSYTSYVNPANTKTIAAPVSEKQLTDGFRSYYANAGYSYKGTYLASVSARLDQSNIFGVNINQKGVPLWSAGLGWKISAEEFYHLQWLPQLKLRATYGYNGNTDRSLSAFTTASYNMGNSVPTRLPYATIINPPNPELRWERVSVVNLALDFSSKANRISGTFEYYIKQGLDLIGETPFAPSTGISSFTGNTANTKSRGIDLSLNARILESTFNWESNIILSYIKEKVTSYKISSGVTSYLQFAQGGSVPYEGRPLYGIYSYRRGGLDPQTGDPIGFIGDEPSTDFAKIISSASPQSIVYHGPSRPVLSGAFRNTLSYKSFSASFNISYSLGYFFRRPTVNYGAVFIAESTHGDYAKRWQKPGDELLTSVPSMPAANNNNRNSLTTYSENLVEKADNVRLQDLRLAWHPRKVFSTRLGLSNLQLYAYANNLGLIWKAAKNVADPDYLYNIPLQNFAAGIKADF